MSDLSKKDKQCLCLLALAICIVLLSILLRVVDMTQHDMTPTQYLVRKGDTLWSLSQTYCPDDMDCRDWIDKVEQVNGLHNGNIKTGQIITIYTEVH